MSRSQRNPFRTRQIRPGAIPYVFNDGRSVKDLAERLQEHHWLGQIVGPHGSGKTTLLRELVLSSIQLGREVQHFTLRDGQRALPFRVRDSRRWHRSTLVVLDGYEQLSWISQLRLRLMIWRKKCGLLITTHRAVSLPIVFRTAVSIAVTQKIVRGLLHDRSRIHEADVAQAFARCAGNVREVLFALYDLYQVRHPLDESPT